MFFIRSGDSIHFYIGRYGFGIIWNPKYWAILKRRKRTFITNRPYVFYKFGPFMFSKDIDE